MSKGQTERRRQPGFMFVFDSKPSQHQATAHNEQDERATCLRSSRIDDDEAKAARQKLIAELREFGC